ncbi:hypothetical protein NJC10_04335 [Micrococcus sp. M4NT]|uniref:hypothetical protein n=1 Tax=Micrococcus sp. M4NT TaxID=2957501 RepID=UPI0029BF413E|nr:hypothetical protein [Micrococcus sp. M4NT]MDX2340907.1 hypothetical protein [Micrococcus sp. M4NT]
MPQPTDTTAPRESSDPAAAPDPAGALAEHGLELRPVPSPWEAGLADPEAPFDLARRWDDAPAVRRHTAVL